VIPMLYGGIVMAILLYKSWAAIQDGHARTTPGKAIGLLFVPFFNIYWAFQAIWGLAKDFNAYIQRNSIPAARLPEGLFLAYCILCFTTWIPVLGLVLLVVNFIIGLIIVSDLCDRINAVAGKPHSEYGPNRFEKDPQESKLGGAKYESLFHDCPYCGAGGIIPDENGKCTNCGTTLQEEPKETGDSHLLTRTSTGKDGYSNDKMDAAVGFHKAADESGSFIQNAPESMMESESDNNKAAIQTQVNSAKTLSENIADNTDLPLAGTHQETKKDNSQMQLTDCPHCLTNNVLPMPGHICPNCKKPLGKVDVAVVVCLNCDTKGIVPMEGNICPNCKKPLM